MKLDTNRKKFIAAVIVVSIILILIFVVIGGGKEDEQVGPGFEPTPTPAAGVVGSTENLGGVVLDENGIIDTNKEGSEWKLYELNSEVSLRLPPEAKVTSNQYRTIVDIGESSGSLEYAYDITLHVNSYNTDGRGLAQIANSDLQGELSEVSIMIKPVTSVNYGDNSGYYYGVKGMGNVYYYYFDLGEGKYLRITSYPRDDNEEIGNKIIENILASLEY